MDSKAFLLSFGMKPGDFDRAEGPIGSDDGFIYEAWAASLRCSENGRMGFQESEEGMAKILFFLHSRKGRRGNPSLEFQKNSQLDLNPEGDSTIEKF